MKKYLLRKSIFNIRMLLVVLVNFVILLEGLMESGYLGLDIERLRNEGDLLSRYTFPFATTAFAIFAGLFPGLPYAYSYLEERNSGYLRFVHQRISKTMYARMKIFFSGLSGGLSILLPGIWIFIISDCFSGDTTLQMHASYFEELIWGPYMYVWGGRLVVMLKTMLLFLFGVMWSELALFYSIIFKNRYVAYVLPFLTYEIIWIVFPGSVLNPVYLVRADFEKTVFIGTPFIVDMLYIILLAIVNGRLMSRRK